MKIIIKILFYIAIGLIPIGIIIRLHHWPEGTIIFILGLLVLLIFFIVQTIKDLILKRNKKINIILQFFIILMSVIIFSKYLYFSFGDYPGLLIIPLFIIMSLIYLFKGKTRCSKLTVASITYLILTFSFFGIDFDGEPRQYIPKDWYNKLDVSSIVYVILPYEFKYYETEQLNIKAFELRKTKHYYEAKIVYEEARKLEPKNLRLLFDLSDIYAKINNLEKAITLLDSAIMIDSSFAGFYNNRGLLFYKLKENDKAISDYLKAIHLDSTQSIFHANLALVYYQNNLNDKSCKSIKKAKSLGFDIMKSKELIRIKKKICK
jgi:tetratricopeptide (TPR) repeat protein